MFLRTVEDACPYKGFDVISLISTDGGIRMAEVLRVVEGADPYRIIKIV